VELSTNASEHLLTLLENKTHISSPLSDVEAVRSAAQAVGKVLGGHISAIVGGAGYALLGSPRTTTDVDILVPETPNVGNQEAIQRPGRIRGRQWDSAYIFPEQSTSRY
jgi:hypothetical protein